MWCPSWCRRISRRSGVCDELRRIIPDGEARTAMIEGFREVRKRLEPREPGGNASDRAAQAVLTIVEQVKQRRARSFRPAMVELALGRRWSRRMSWRW